MKRRIDSEGEKTHHDPKSNPETPEHRHLHAGEFVIRMDILAYILLGLSGLVGLAAGIESYHHKSPSIWIACTSGVLFVLSVCCYWQDIEWKRESVEKASDDAASKPTVTVDIGNTLDPSAPLETRFIVTNQGPGSIHEIWWEFQMWDARYYGPLFVQPCLSRTYCKSLVEAWMVC
jgi:hypothetical protein